MIDSHTNIFNLKESLKEELSNYFKPYIDNDLSELYVMSIIRVIHRDIVSSSISDKTQIKKGIINDK